MSTRYSPTPEPRRDQTPLKRRGETLRSRKQSIPTETGNEIWLLTLSDLLMLLLIFFVLLFGWMFHTQRQAAATPASAEIPAVSVPAAAGPAVPVTVAPAAPPAPAPMAEQNQQETAPSLESDLLALVGGEQGVTIERRSHHLVATFPEQFLFASGLSGLKRSVEPLLEKVALFILDHPDLAVEINGHTDDRPINSRRFPSNWELSADRATQVAKALVRMGVEPSRLSIKGFGEYRPRYANDSDENRLKNRRVEIQFSLPSAS